MNDPKSLILIINFTGGELLAECARGLITFTKTVDAYRYLGGHWCG